MRSVRRSMEGQECLPLDLPPPPEVSARERPAPGPASSRVREDGDLRIRLRNDALASRGWPAGTELVVATDRRPRRGEVALVKEGGRLRIGVLEVQYGRSALRTDHGSVLLGSTARTVGVVTVAAAPLEGMPAVVPSGP
ncbi:hypothetical protein BJ993_000079 [Nocardioides aromaticivorans]|uniref:Uncharacterized protein n=1 Tax=Nocardioides aromaticivorans TaxID=200618 RepID=A0A7Y9ZCS1_9ACTN|nr:hypothetical protein [Nocardioides aromaticivorans]NYI42999.1 hypothetical protein [Nocardioides aromaticivorans]